MKPNQITISQSGAFVETFKIPPTKSGLLNGLEFAVKDLIDIAGYKTGCGNPSWRDTHPLAHSHAVCVEQLLAAGGCCIGKTISDEMAFSLVGENSFYGTPLNPKAPQCVPGGSSSGSASAVACGLVDFALGTDTGGSVRVPANNCGVWGFRPSHGFISVAGVMPFAPTFDTVGIFARSPDILAKSAQVLLGTSGRSEQKKATSIHLVKEAFALLEPSVQKAFSRAIKRLGNNFGAPIQATSLIDIVGDEQDAELNTWLDTFCVIQWSEIESSLGSWIAESNPVFGVMTRENFELVKKLDRSSIALAIIQREKLFRKLRHFLKPSELLCIPTAPSSAPLKGSFNRREGTYYRHALSLTSIAGIGRLPQISIPLSSILMKEESAPIGLSLLGAYGEDAFLLDLITQL